MKKDIQIVSDPIDVQACIQSASNPECGGIVSFVGTVRNHTQEREVVRLEFESYDAMAIKEMTKIADSIFDQWPAQHVTFHHRKGNLQIGEVAVVIVVACPHRAPAFEACQFAIDTLKKTVPIWKKEIFTDGEVWVSAHP